MAFRRIIGDIMDCNNVLYHTIEVIIILWFIGIFCMITYREFFRKKEKDNLEKERATELEYLTWFHLNVDFGPASEDVEDQMKRDFIRKTGKNIPKGWNVFSDGETLTDV
jgi:hypothetical protein